MSSSLTRVSILTYFATLDSRNFEIVLNIKYLRYISGQSYEGFTMVNYDANVILTVNLPLVVNNDHKGFIRFDTAFACNSFFRVGRGVRQIEI